MTQIPAQQSGNVCLQVRFFERVKVERQINKLEGKQLRGHALSSDEQQQLQSAKLDLQARQLQASGVQQLIKI